MRTYAIASGKGGTGKTTVAANLGWAMAQNGWNVLLFDADLTLANLDVVLGVRPAFTLQHVLAGRKTIREAICPAAFGVGLIAGGSAVSSLMRSGKKRIATFLTQLADLDGEYDALIFDVSAGVDNKVMTFCRAVDEILLVTTPDPAAVLDAYALAKVVFRNRTDARAQVVVNQVESEAEAKRIFRSVQSVTQRFLDKDLDYAGHIRLDPTVGESLRRRVPLVYAQPSCPAAQDVVILARNLMRAAMHGSTGGFAGRLEAMIEPSAA